MNTLRYKKLNEIEGLEDLHDYAVDTDGNVYSWKHNNVRKLSPGWTRRKNGYLFVRLTDCNGVKKNYRIHRLVAMAFLPCDDHTLEVNHLNRNTYDNTIENLQWVTRKENNQYTSTVNGFSLDDYIIAKTKEVHSASIRKGLPVPDSHSFLNTILEGALEDYINQYGLRKVMNTLPSPH